ncbi:MAG: Dabb family protein [Coriobacteriia bacterium]
MIKHIVAWRFKDEALGSTKAENLLRAKEALESLRGIVPGLLHLEAGIDVRAASDPWDIALYSEFDSRDSLNAYQTHPEHVKVAGLIAEMREARAAVDYEA